MPDNLTMVSSGEEGVTVYFLPEIYTIGLLEMAKGLVIGNHTGDDEY